jgi:nitrogen fixation protein NifU and related proteins
MSDLRELYQELIIDHSKRPRNFKVLETADRKAEGYNPLCGDKVTVFLELEDERVKNASFQGSGCAISTASASVMTESVKGKTLAEVEALFDIFHQMVMGKPAATGSAPELGKLAVFSGVSEFPARVKCATLAWHTLHAALQGAGETVSTE